MPTPNTIHSKMHGTAECRLVHCHRKLADRRAIPLDTRYPRIHPARRDPFTSCRSLANDAVLRCDVDAVAKVNATLSEARPYYATMITARKAVPTLVATFTKM